ncbi:unnamed protein product [Ambrosiozyma monospora]|uniref:Unnamed protein product n=1 Tax=Ambrosiozyma monospora TaxID=43982 RepID=A0A9W6YZ33_AMBMO|nr:unnamed protein product [Ambrosiozyma monospora]
MHFLVPLMTTNSNILNALTPKEGRDLTAEESKDCLPCQVMATFTAAGASYYFASGRIFKNDTDFVKNPTWWRQTMKFAGYGLGLFAVYRGGQGWLWQKDREYKQVKFL